MKKLTHTSADASHYDKSADNYDVLNEDNSKILNKLLEDILAKYNITSVLDITCGTGSQIFWLHNAGYQIVGSDISSKMLAVARSKAVTEAVDIEFIEGDMRTVQVGHFDAVISMFNAVGHLTKNDFELSMRNIAKNLNPGGLYIFDINNLSYLLNGDNITKLTIDWYKEYEGRRVRKIQYSTISKSGILASFTTSHTQGVDDILNVEETMQTLQVYTLGELTKILDRNGFEVVEYSGIDGSNFLEKQTEVIFLVARKL